MGQLPNQKNEIVTQRSGYDFERRSDGAGERWLFDATHKTSCMNAASRKCANAGAWSFCASFPVAPQGRGNGTFLILLCFCIAKMPCSGPETACRSRWLTDYKVPYWCMFCQAEGRGRGEPWSLSRTFACWIINRQNAMKMPRPQRGFSFLKRRFKERWIWRKHWSRMPADDNSP